MNKRGQSHIEFIISFALFTTFVVLILLLFKPSFKSSEIGLNAIENSIMEKVNINLSFYSVKIPQVMQNCFCLNNDIGINFIVKDKNKNIINSFDAGGICINKNEIASTTNFYYVYIYFSDEFGEPSKDGAGCLSLQDSGVEKGPLRELSVVSNNSLYILNERYYTEYTQLKQELGITNYDFGVLVLDDKGNSIVKMSRTIPLGRPVYSKDVPIEIIYKDGNSTYDIMRISAW